MEERQARADQWSERALARMGTVEPEWWLRMMCGQLAHEESAAHYAGVRRVLRRAAREFRQRFGARSQRWPVD